MRPMLPCQDRDANRIVQCNMFPWKLGVKDKEETDQCQGWGSPNLQNIVGMMK